MRTKNPGQINLVLLLLILATALLLRLWGLANMPFQHDEFSAIFRLAYDNLAALMREGVALRDSHPAGVQIFLYYWSKITGFDHIWMRLPFVLFGVGSIWLVYDAGRKLFGQPAGLMAAATMAVMQYFVYYSQMARPYIPGVFFNLLAFNLLLTIKGEEKTRFGLPHFGLAISLSLAAWVHHFSAFQAGLVFLSGFFQVERKHIKGLMLTALLAFVLYLPCLGITLIQLRAGGIGDWLAKPDLSFITGYFGYLANYSLLFAGVLIIPRFIYNKQLPSAEKLWGKRLLLAMLFLIPLILAWLYSVLRVPVLQYSTLIFGFPFLLIAFFSFGKDASQKFVAASVVLILLSGSGSLLLGRRHVHTMQRQAFREAPRLAETHSTQLGGDYTFVAISSTPAMFGFYMPENENIKHYFFNMREPAGNLTLMFDTLQTEYLGLAWADYVPYEWVSSARAVYSEVVEHRSWFNAEYFLLRRSDKPNIINGKERIVFRQDFIPSVIIPGDEYALLFESDTLFVPSDDVVAVLMRCVAVDTVKQARLVLEFRNHPESQPEVWRAGQVHRAILPGETFTLTAAWRFDSGEAALRKALFRTYLWNPGHEHFEVVSRRIWTATYDKELFGLFKPF